MLFLPLAGLQKHDTLEQKVPQTTPHTSAAALDLEQKMLSRLSIAHALHLRKGLKRLVAGTYGEKGLPESDAGAEGFGYYTTVAE